MLKCYMAGFMKIGKIIPTGRKILVYVCFITVFSRDSKPLFLVKPYPLAIGIQEEATYFDQKLLR